MPPAQLVDDAQAQDGDTLLLAKHGQAGCEAREEVAEGGGAGTEVGQQGQKEEYGGEELGPAHSTSHCLRVDGVRGE